ncbi:hypothetical protein FALBO_11573 [Fusarium albosuccineum]|uniref:Uncharacterized protein n=1 Tax=Fusarium albosuccineum TaxID=1237068 RepID=A0A8H4L4T1_9HYPO|nr:hypothetical protein FALBO_11573 [Fusarium albosuccineum]
MEASGGYGGGCAEASVSYSTTSIARTAAVYNLESSQCPSRQTQSFDGYATTMPIMYNIPQPSAQNLVHDSRQSRSRQPTAVQATAQDVAGMYFESESGSPVDSGLQHSIQSSGRPAYLYRQANASDFASDVPRADAITQATASADISIIEQRDCKVDDLMQNWDVYQRQLATIFQDIMKGCLENAAEILLTVTDWLLSHAADLGLNLDDTNLHEDRVKFWHNFNYAWLGLGQRQLELMTSSKQLSRPQGLIPKAVIKKMGNALIRSCDGIEQHGLVDYQYGVWEEEILAALEDCLDMYEARDKQAMR